MAKDESFETQMGAVIERLGGGEGIDGDRHTFYEQLPVMGTVGVTSTAVVKVLDTGYLQNKFPYLG